MAYPRVFISSTCYDLTDERDGLNDFCSTFGFETTLSERGDVFYHPDLHTHTSCIRETSNCHLFILIIGGRFGGKYKLDTSKSITNAEYSAAIQNSTPVFTFIKQDVLNDHNVWQKNKDAAFAKDIQYPSIDKQEHAEDIFKFVDEVRLAPVNNGIFGFRTSKDIHEILRKQWASMMFDYLQNRSITKQISLTNDALSNLAVVSGKIEELVKNIYRNVDTTGASAAIEAIDTESLADEFLVTLVQKLEDRKFISEVSWDNGKGSLPPTWWQFLVSYSFCTVKTELLANGEEVQILEGLGKRKIQRISGTLGSNDDKDIQALQLGYTRFCALTPETRHRLASKYFWTRAESDEALRRYNEETKDKDSNKK